MQTIDTAPILASLFNILTPYQRLAWLLESYGMGKDQVGVGLPIGINAGQDLSDHSYQIYVSVENGSEAVSKLTAPKGLVESLGLQSKNVQDRIIFHKEFPAQSVDECNQPREGAKELDDLLNQALANRVTALNLLGRSRFGGGLAR